MKYKWFSSVCDNPRCPQRRGVLRSLLAPPGGVLLNNQWLCSPGCLDQVLAELLPRLIESSRANRNSKIHRFPLGLLLLSLGVISNESLQSALNAQREAGKGRVGDWLRWQGAVTEPQITQALAQQWALPIFPLEKWNSNLNWAHLLPMALLESFRMLPVHYSPAISLLYVAFSSQVDYTALYAIEQMLDFRTQPCVAQESHLERALEELRREHSIDSSVEGPVESSIISTNTVQEALKLGARAVKVVGCANNIWVRLRTQAGPHDLLFRLPADR